MKSRETKQNDLNALTESLQNSTSAMVVSFSGVTVAKDQEFRNRLREAGAKYEVVKNTLARIAVKGTQFEGASEHFKGVTALAWTDGDPVVLSKAISKFMKDNEKQYSFKTGVVDGKLVDLKQLTTIANLPSKEELISKLLFVLQSGAQRLVTVINAVPRDLAVVIKQIGEQEGRASGTPTESVAAAPAVTHEVTSAAAEETPAVGAEAAQTAEVAEPSVEEAPVEAVPVMETAPVEDKTETQAEIEADAPADAAEAVLEPRDEAQSPDDKAEAALETPPEGSSEDNA